MSNLKEMPLDTTLQKGDVVTITGPGEHDVLVQEVTGVRENGTAEVTGWNFAGIPLIHKSDRTLTRVQRPVPALPTVEGDYILTMADGSRYVRSFSGGEWRGHTHKTAHVPRLREYVEAGATLTRVIPADEVKRPEVDVAAAVAAFVFVSGESLCADDFASTLRRVLEGEFDL